MSKRTLGIVMLVVGILIVAAIVVGAQLGWPNPGFGLKKIAGLVVGAIVFVAGLVISMRNKPAVK
jgi:hypothetical protein